MFKPIHEWTKQDLIDALRNWDFEFWCDGDTSDEYAEMDYGKLHDEVYARGIFETYLGKQ